MLSTRTAFSRIKDLLSNELSSSSIVLVKSILSGFHLEKFMERSFVIAGIAPKLNYHCTTFG